jgi:hypothetical protein
MRRRVRQYAAAGDQRLLWETASHPWRDGERGILLGHEAAVVLQWLRIVQIRTLIVVPAVGAGISSTGPRYCVSGATDRAFSLGHWARPWRRQQ